MCSAGPEKPNGGLLQSVSAPVNILLLAPALSDGQDTCSTIGQGDGEATTLLVVVLNGSFELSLEGWRRYRQLPENVCVVSSEEMRSASTAMNSTTKLSTDTGEMIQLQSISSPGDLLEIGRGINRCLGTSSVDGGQRHVCFDSLTTVLNYVDTKPAYQFFHSLLPAMRRQNCIAHFHMDPDAHDEKTVAIIQSLFKSTFQYDKEAGAWTSD